MSYISSIILVFFYIYIINRFSYVRASKPFLILLSLFVFRLILSLNHQISFQPIVAGQSLNSVFSIFSVLILFFVVSRKFASYRSSIPLYVLIFSALISGLFSGLYVGGAIVAMKWMLMLLVISCLVDLFSKLEVVAVLKPFSFVFIGLLFSQFLSIILKQGKDTESLVSESNAISYIAGYAHEGAFSILLFMGLLVSSILLLNNKENKYLPIIFFIGLVFANYRTTVLSAVIPLLCTYLSVYYIEGKKNLKIVVVGSVTVAVSFVVFFMGESIVSRFGEIGTALTSIGELMTIDFSMFSREEKRLLSSRLYLWNMYIGEYSQLGFMGKILGSGPESWSSYFIVYAHNNFVGTLFDLGALGLFSLVLLLGVNLLLISKIRSNKLKITLLGFLLGFFIMSNATMPFWAIEGIYAYSFLFAVSLWYRYKNNLQ